MRVIVGGDEARHAVTVKRLSAGEPVLVGDGAGASWRALSRRRVASQSWLLRSGASRRRRYPNHESLSFKVPSKANVWNVPLTMTEVRRRSDCPVAVSQRSIVRIGDDAGAKVVAKLRAKAMNAAKRSAARGCH